jgi:hypothetical protein
MEDIIKIKLCNFCKCQKKDCKNIKESKQGTCEIYKCLNFETDSSKIKPYQKFNYLIRSNNDKMKNKNIRWS